jgi:hypothetical protein
MVRRDFFFRLPATTPVLLQGITAPLLVMVTPEKPALQPERVRLHPEGMFVSRSVPAKGSPETTSKDGRFNDRIFP